MPSRRWFRPRLPGDARSAWVRSLDGRSSRALAWAPTPEGWCIGSPAALSVGRGAVGGGSSWVHVGWHEIQSGGWDADTARLRWLPYGGEPVEVELLEPGRLPELFRERVAASIVVEQYVAWRGSQGITVSGRRDLGDSGAPLRWHTTLTPGVSERTPGVTEAVATALQRVRAEYDIG